MTNADYVRAFARAIAKDRQLVLEMGRILDRAQAINIDFRDTARLRLQQQIQLLVRNIEREYQVLHGIDLWVGDNGGWLNERPFIIARYLVQARQRALAFSRILERAPILDLDREPGLALLASITEDLDSSAALAAELAWFPTQPSERKTVRRSPLRASLRIASLAVRLLPWEERQRYHDEYLSELHALAQDENLSGRAQLAHALRLLVRTPALRFALRRRAESGLITSRPEA